MCDFQLSTICNPARDLAYFLVCNLSPSDRRLWSGDLGAIYREAPKRNGVEDNKEGRMIQDVRLWVLLPLIMDIACVGDLRAFLEELKEKGGAASEDYKTRNRRNLTHRERLFAALEDFEAEKLIATLRPDKLSVLPFFGCCCCWWAK